MKSSIKSREDQISEEDDLEIPAFLREDKKINVLQKNK